MATPIRVLLVEDSELDAQLLLSELRKSDRPVESSRVETASALKATLMEHPWDLMVCDYSLPGFSGLEALQIARTRCQDLPCIMVSGVVGEEKAVALMKAGANDFIMKDNLARLVPVVQRELREAEIRRERRRAVEAFEKLFLSAPIGIFLIQDGKFKMVNPGFVQITKYEEGDLLGQGSLSLLPEEDRQPLRDNLVQRLTERSAPL